MKTTALLMATLLLAACSKAPKGDLAPAGVAGKIIEMDGHPAESCSSPIGQQKWTEWIPEEHPCVFAYTFDETNRYRVNFNPTDIAYLTYEKAGPNTAIIRNYGAPNHGTYTLNFETPTTGTATNNGQSNGRDYMTRKIKFSIK